MRSYPNVEAAVVESSYTTKVQITKDVHRLFKTWMDRPIDQNPDHTRLNLGSCGHLVDDCTSLITMYIHTGLDSRRNTVPGHIQSKYKYELAVPYLNCVLVANTYSSANPSDVAPLFLYMAHLKNNLREAILFMQFENYELNFLALREDAAKLWNLTLTSYEREGLVSLGFDINELLYPSWLE